MPNVENVINQLVTKRDGVSATYRLGDIIEGYYYEGKFYKEATHQTEIQAASGFLYIDLVRNRTYIYRPTLLEYTTVGGPCDNMIFGYYNNLDGKFYKESTFTTQIVGNKDNVYISLNTDNLYRYNDTTSAYILLETGGVRPEFDDTRQRLIFNKISQTDNLIWGYYDPSTDKFYQTSTFDIELPGLDGCIYVDMGNSSTYYYDEVETTYILLGSGTDNGIQKEELPTASVDTLGNIYQYVGTTGSGLVNGFFYECVLDGSTYKWVVKDVQSRSDVEAIEAMIPSGASSSNKLATANDISDLDTRVDDIEDVIPSTASSSNQVATASDITSLDGRLDDVEDVIPSTASSSNKLATAGDVNLKLDASEKGAASGVAELDSNGKVPSSQLPSYVDDVIEAYYNTTDGKFYEESTFVTEITPEDGKIYVDLIENKTYRWTGSVYVEISSGVVLGETSSTAYRGDRGKIAYDHSQSTHARTDATKVEASETNGNIQIDGTETTVYTHPGSGTNPHGTTASDVGLGNVGNFKAVSTEANQGLSATEQANARANIGAGDSSLTLGETATDAYYGDKGKTAYDHSQLITGNPHNVTKTDIGLGNVDNTSDLDKPISTATQDALNLKEDVSNLGTAAYKDIPLSGDASTTQVVMGNDSRLSDARNAADVSAWAKASTKPTYTASEVGAIPLTDKGSNGGVAELDSSGKVPSSQLPSFVDDVIEGYYNTTDGKFYKESTYTTEITGESGKIYLDLFTDTTWRWSGSAFTQIKGDLTLGETSTTAYRGDRGKAAYDHSQSTHARVDATKVESSSTNGNIKINDTETTVYTHPGSGTNPHGTTASDVGLGNVGNFKAVSTEASQGLTDTEKSNARANIGAGTSSFSGDYDDLTNKPTLGTASAKDIPVSGNASTTQVVMGDDTRLTDSREASDVYSWAKAASKPTYTANEVGAIASSEKGANSGVAELDSNGKVPNSQLPSYVDDVIEGYYNTTDNKFYEESTYTTEIPGETGKIYISLDTNKTYRWGGSTFVTIASDLALGETSSTAYRGDRGKTAYDTALANDTRLDTIEEVIPSTATSSNKLATVNDIPDELEDIGDVNLTNIQNGETLVWDDTNSKWVNGEGGKTYSEGFGIDIDNTNEISVDDTYIKSTFVGTKAQWDVLSVAEKAKYILVNITDDADYASNIVDAITDGDLSAVTSNAVYDALQDKADTTVVSKTANGLAPQLPNETSTDKYLRQDGTWAVPPDTIGTYDSTARSNASSALSNEAPSYSSSTAYSVGQFVMYNNTTYECIKATSAGTAPTNTTYWSEKKLGNKLTELNSALIDCRTYWFSVASQVITVADTWTEFTNTISIDEESLYYIVLNLGGKISSFDFMCSGYDLKNLSIASAGSISMSIDASNTKSCYIAYNSSTNKMLYYCGSSFLPSVNKSIYIQRINKISL